MARGWLKVGMKVRDGYGKIAVWSEGQTTDEKLDNAFKHPDWDKLKNAGDEPARYGCYFEDDWPVLICVYDKTV
ncbi:hypothetical protein ANCCAN_18797 [Ancylostoma caninum]|uniref:Uncharacterized protein n=1 Tax=Ancylostoma caninum TaxID=29170 RepID=A0A368FX07_ANCCA|nr:hypothetical protein ANCCAN_18797 [Ancylostoma caninum]